MKTEIDWNIFCECVNCMSIHPKGYNETKGIELPVNDRTGLETLNDNPWMAKTILKGVYEMRKEKHSITARAIQIVLDENADLLAQLETAQQQWISVSEGLPEKQALSVGIRDGRYVNQQQGEVEVLITTNLGRVLCRRYTTLGFPNLKFGEGEEAIAWMPLPTPCDPKGE